MAKFGRDGGETAVECQFILLHQLECRDGGDEFGA